MKKLHRFMLTSLPTTPSFDITEPALVHQLVNVLKYKDGESFIVFAEGSDDMVVSIDTVSKKILRVTTQDTIAALPPQNKKVVAAVSIVKRDLFELIVQKLTELGVHEIVPVLSARTIKQSTRHDRLESISREAVEQSGQNTLVRIHEPMTLEQCLAQYDFPSIVFDPLETTSTPVIKDVAVMYIGPEGGWSQEDIALFKQHGAHFNTLGNTILRTETAAIVGAYTILSL